MTSTLDGQTPPSWPSSWWQDAVPNRPISIPTPLPALAQNPTLYRKQNGTLNETGPAQLPPGPIAVSQPAWATGLAAKGQKHGLLAAVWDADAAAWKLPEIR